MQQGLQKPSKSTTKTETDIECKKTSQILTRPNKTSDMNNELHVSTYIKTITEETNKRPNEKQTAKTSVQIQHWMLNLTRWYQYIFTESIRRWETYIQTNSWFTEAEYQQAD